MRLYTTQPADYWETCKAAGVMTPSPSLAQADLLPAYDWMREQMAKRLPAFSGDYPVWAWWDRPDLRKYILPPDEPYVLLTLEVPPERVLLSNFQGWDYILYGWLIGEHPATEAVRQSWEYIFKSATPAPYRLPWPSFGTQQACIDRVYAHEVVEARPIRRRQRRDTGAGTLQLANW